MAEYINKAKAIAYVEEQYRLFRGDIKKQAIVEGCIEALMFTPTADVEEVKHGEWEQGVPYVCSICGKPAPDEKNTSERYSCWTSPYCPHCGAKMDGSDAE